jgi:hypothetical protein
MPRFSRLRRFAGRHLPVATRADVRAIRRRARRFATAYQGLAAAAENHRAPHEARATPPSPDEAAAAQEKVRVAHAKAELFERLSRGDSFEAAAVTAVRRLIKAGRVTESASFADALVAGDRTEVAGHLAAAVVAAHRKLPELALAEFDHVPAELWRAHALAEYTDVTYRCDLARAVETIRELVADRPAELGPQAWFQVLRYAFVAGELGLARQAYGLLVEGARQRPREWAAAETEIAWLRPWMEAGGDTAAAPSVAEGQVPFALIDYRQPGRAKTSQNIGDHIQTLASLGHLVRHKNVRFHGDADIASFAADMQRRVRPERQLDTPAVDVALFTADRDASTYQTFPEGTWALVFGWYMHPLFGLRHDFPLHPNLRPIFVSFHCNKREMLNAEAIDYLRRYGPVGCRDWTTVDLLLSIDVPAFFSGCLTTTVDTVFPELDDTQRPGQQATAYVDVPAGSVPPGAARIRHSDPTVKQRTFAANMRKSVSLLDEYRSRFSSVVTSRLHCYLPVRSLGLDVDFRPKNRADVRFNGLIDIDDAAFDAIRTGLLDRLEATTGAVLAGRPREEVYQLWHDLCADDVAAARARHESGEPLQEPSLDVADAVRRVHVRAAPEASTASGHGPMAELVIPVQAGDIGRLPLMVESVQASSSRPVRLWLLARSCGDKQHNQLANALPKVPVTWLHHGDLSWDVAMILLPELLSEIARAVVLPPAAVVLEDIAMLADRDLGGCALAARTSAGTAASSGFGVLYRAARRLTPDAAAAHELYRRIHARHVFDFDAFDTDVLVLDLQRMRKDGMAAEFIPYIEHFGLRASEVLTLYAGPDHAVLPAEWAHVPTDERVTDPKLVYWPGAAKPWQARYVARQELWRLSTGS